MLKNFIFSALLLNMIAVYLSYKRINKPRNSLPLLFTMIGTGLFFSMTALSINLIFSAAPILFNFPALLWFLIALGIIIEVFSVYRKVIPGQLIAASIFLFLVYPTILSIGIYLLLIAIIELILALMIFQKTRDIGF